MVCGYDKLRSGQIAKRGAWNTCASKAEAAMLDLTPTAQPPIMSAPAVDRTFRRAPPPGVYSREPYLSDARPRRG
jgi:hypothetical protein